MKISALFMGVLFATAFAAGQDSMHVVIISPRVGPDIDARERQQFHLFSQVEGFVSATIYALGDSGYVAVIQVQGPEGALEQKRIPYPLPVLLTMAEKINHYDEIEQGTYVWGSDRPTLQIADGAVVGWTDMPKSVAAQVAPTAPQRWQPDLLPFATNLPPMENRRATRFRFSAGLSNAPGSLQPIQKMITDIENSLRAQGYSPGYSTVDEHLGALLWFGAGIEFPGGLDVRLETGSALAKYATFHVAELMVLYHLPPLTSDQFSVVIGAGGTIALFGFNRTFNYGTRISVIDANGGYTVLDDLTVSGSANAGGVVALAGVEVLPTASRDLTLGLSARYQHLGKLPVNAVSTYSSQIDLSGVLVVFTVAVNF